MIVSLDPGVKEAGVAVFDDGELTYAFLARGGDWRSTARNAARNVPKGIVQMLVMERMQIYVPGRSKGNANDLIPVTLMAGAVAAHLEPDDVKLYLPAQWKGQLPKNVVKERLLKSLAEEEKRRIELPKAAGKAHNVWDAIGIGMKYLRRL